MNYNPGKILFSYLVLLTFVFTLHCSPAGTAKKPNLPSHTNFKYNRDLNSEIIYFILIDRFCNGDPGNDYGNNPASHIPWKAELHNDAALKTYQGGDLQGIINKLGYLDSLGVTTIWLSPVFDNSDADFVGWYPYHGYHPVDFYAVDEHFGDMKVLKELINRAHTRGIKIILDMICNHVAPDHPWVVDPVNWNDQGYRNWFHPHSGVDASTSIQDWQNQEQLENRELNGLPDLDQDNPQVYDFLLNVARFWIAETGCDGYRLDAVKHIPQSFWIKYCRDIHNIAGSDFILLGEVFEGSTAYVARYRALGFNSLFDIPMYYTMNRVFAQGANINLLSEQLAVNDSSYHGLVLSTLLDNHDVARFSYRAGTNAADKLIPGLVFMFTQSGMPMIYYGTEIPLPGAAPENEQTGAGQDYLNRLPMDWGKVYTNNTIAATIKKLTRLRRQSSALQNGLTWELYKDYGIYIFVRYNSSGAILAAINNSACMETRVIAVEKNFLKNCEMTDLVNNLSLVINTDTLFITLPPFSGALYDFGKVINHELLPLQTSRCVFTPRLTGDYRIIPFSYTAGKGNNITGIAVAGDFNGWSPVTDLLMDEDNDGNWQLNLPLKPGKYRYKFVINSSEWIADPAAVEFELDPYGGKNSLLIIP
ncbi:MAG TPA: alpha-amylase family glycosyl hydrolase [bacterium]|nr:alpha-amylase family glycosyl hydrolase [bacterium]HPN43030.1 alpha-amylase family glycosyl hydrolase [bacterium]